MPNFKNGIDFNADPTGNTAFANHFFVSKSGSDANNGSLASPWLTVKHALESGGMTDGDTLIVGTGYYQENQIAVNANHDVNTDITGDGIVIIDGNSGTLFSSGRLGIIQNISFSNYAEIYSGLSNLVSQYVGCYFVNCSNADSNYPDTGGFHVTKCVIKDCNFTFLNLVTRLLQSVIINTSISATVDSIFFDYNHLDVNSSLDVSARGGSLGWNYIGNNVNGVVTGISPIQDNIDADPLFENKSNPFELSVTELSPLLRVIDSFVYTNSVNIGSVKIGRTLNSDAVELNANAQFDNVQISGSVYELIDPGLPGTVTSSRIDMVKRLAAPELTATYFGNFTTNVPDFENSQVNHNFLDVEVRYGITLDDFQNSTFKKFRWGEDMVVDSVGNGNGTDGFDWSDTVPVVARYFQVRITLRSNYANA